MVPRAVPYTMDGLVEARQQQREPCVQEQDQPVRAAEQVVAAAGPGAMVGRGLGAASSDVRPANIALVGQRVQVCGEGGESEHGSPSTRRNLHSEPIRWTGQRHGRRGRQGPPPEADEDGAAHGLPQADAEVPESGQEPEEEKDTGIDGINIFTGIFDDHYFVFWARAQTRAHAAENSAREAAVEPPVRQ